MYLKTISFMHPWQRGAITAMTKKGSQQMMKAPVTMANVLAAFFSRFASSEMCFFSFFSLRGLKRVLNYEDYVCGNYNADDDNESQKL